MSNTILLVEPDPERVPLLERVLGLSGHSVIVTTDHLAALETFQRIRPDLVVIDAAPPDLQGFELCHVLKETPQGQWTPVLVACERQDGKSFRAQALHQHGADEFVETPIDDDELSACVGRLIDSWAVQREAAERAGDERPEPVEQPVVPARMMDDDTVIDALDRFDSLVDEVELDRPCRDDASGVSELAATWRDPLHESLDELESDAEELLDQLRDAPPEVAPGPLAARAGESAASLRASLDELSDTISDEAAPTRPEIQLAGDHGADIEGHLDDLFAHGLVAAATDEPGDETVVSDSEPAIAAVTRSGVETETDGRREPEEADVPPPSAWRPEPAHVAPESSPAVSPEPPGRVAEAATAEVESPAEPPVSEFPLTFTGPASRRRGVGPVFWVIAASVLVLLGGAFWLQSMRDQGTLVPTLAAQTRPAALPATAPIPSTTMPPPPPSATLDIVEPIETSPVAAAVPQVPAVEGPAMVKPKPVETKPKPAEARPLTAAVAPAPTKPDEPAPAPVTAKPIATKPEPTPPVVATAADPSLPPAPPVAPVAPVATKPAVTTPEPKPVTAVAKPAPTPRPARPPVVEPPVALRRVEPAYPPKAVKRAEGGTVELRVLVSEAGRPVRVVVEQGMDGSEFEAAAIDAVLRWEYRPGTENGQPVRSWITERFEFKPQEP